jgi:hypothetical protein
MLLRLAVNEEGLTANLHQILPAFPGVHIHYTFQADGAFLRTIKFPEHCRCHCVETEQSLERLPLKKDKGGLLMRKIGREYF